MKYVLRFLFAASLVSPGLFSQSTNAVSFDGSLQSYIGIPYSSALQPTAAITVEMWMNVNVWTGTAGVVGNTEFGGYEFNIEQSGGENRLVFYVKRNGMYAAPYITQAAFGSGWHHVAATFDGRYTKLYLDGVLHSTDDASGNYPIQYSYSNSLIIGAEAYTAAVPYGYYFTGSIEEMRIWNIARPIDSIHAAMDRELAGTETGLAGYWSFNEASGSTAIDHSPFSQNGTLSYGVTRIVFDNSMSWYSLGTPFFSDGNATSLSLSVASNGTPYVAYADGANGTKATVMKYTGASWTSVGSKGFTPGVAADVNLTLAGDGTPYIVYRDGANGNKASVQKYNGTNWEQVGAAGFSAGTVSAIRIAVTSAGTPYVGFTDGANGSKPTAMSFDGSSWNIVGTAGITAGMPNGQWFALSNDGIPYFAVSHSPNNHTRASVMYFDGTNWTHLGIAGFSSSDVTYIKLAFNPSNVPYVIYSESNAVNVMNYTGSWVAVGSNISSVYTSAMLPQIAFAPDGTPYITFIQGNYLSLKKFNGTDWQFVGTARTSNSLINEPPTIAVNALGVPYEVHSEYVNGGKGTLRRYVTLADAALPVELSSFHAIAAHGSVELTWRTATEQNNYGFEIQRSASGGQVSEKQWTKAGFIAGAGSSNSSRTYSFTDVSAHGTLAYRLKQIDRDGKFSYSAEVKVTAGAAPNVFALVQNFPNPFNPSTTLGFTIQVSGSTTLKIYDALGREVSTLVNEHLEAGVYHERTFDASHLSSGIYFARLTSGGSSQMIKMSLIK